MKSDVILLLEDYSSWLEAHGYLDSDWWEETPSAITRYVADKKKKAAKKK
jgi:hypothetical protein